MNFIQSILDNPDSIFDYPPGDNPQLDNLENMSLSDRVYILYSYLIVTEGDSLDIMRLRLFESELDFLKLANFVGGVATFNRKKDKLNESWNKLVSEDRDKRIVSLLV